MKKIITLTYLLLVTTGVFSQTSFKIRIDSIPDLGYISPYFKLPAIKKCLDDGYVITYGTYGSQSNASAFIIKTDSTGTIEWSKNYIATGYENATTNIALTSDSGFYFEMESEDYMFSFTYDDFMKLDKNGNIIVQKTTAPSSGYWGDGMEFREVEENTNNLIVVAGHSSDDGSGNPCCGISYIRKYDTSLNVLFSKTIDFGLNGGITTIRKIYDAGNPSGYLVAGISTYPINKYGIVKLDSNAQVIWGMDYIRPYPYSNGDNLWDILQVDSTYYLLEKNAVRKIDFYGNTLFYKILGNVSTNNIMFTSMIRGDSNHLLIGGLTLPGFSPLMIETDLNCNISQAKMGTDSFCYFSGIDTSTKEFLFIKAALFSPFNGSGYIDFEREFINNPSCNFVPFTLSPSNGTSQESSVIKTTLDYNIVLSPVSIPSVSSSITETLICTSATAINEINKEPNQLKIFPNPASLEFEIADYNFQAGDEILVSDVTGKNLFRKKISATALNFKIKTSGFSNGIYFVQVKMKDRVVNKKVVVEH